MEMPTPCPSCDKWVELNDMRRSVIWDRELVCETCAQEHNRVRKLRSARSNLKEDLANNAEYMKGQRSKYRHQVYDIEKEISDLGYDIE